MGKEIERKFIINPNLDNDEFIKTLEDLSTDKVVIKDHYFNPMSRIRFMNKKVYITIKSLDMLNRNEWEFEVVKDTVDFIPNPMLVKTRYYVPYENHVFEVNVYKDISYRNHKNLILVEVELQSEDEEIKLPEWIDNDVTYHPSFYNYNIFNLLNKKE